MCDINCALAPTSRCLISTVSWGQPEGVTLSCKIAGAAMLLLERTVFTCQASPVDLIITAIGPKAVNWRRFGDRHRCWICTGAYQDFSKGGLQVEEYFCYWQPKLQGSSFITLITLLRVTNSLETICFT